MRANYARLLEAENIKFRNGESSLFLVNSRELKYIDSLVKQFQLEAKVKATQAKLEAEASSRSRQVCRLRRASETGLEAGLAGISNLAP